MEYAFWVAAFTSIFAFGGGLAELSSFFSNRHLILTEIAWLGLFALFLVARRMVHAPFGLSLLSIKGNPTRAAAVGIPVNRRLVAIYTIAAGYAGVAGALLTQTTAFASLDVFSFERSADLLLVLIIGGAGYLYGGLIGAIVFKLMQDFLSALTPQYWPFWIGLLLVAIVLVGRDRIGSWTLPLRSLAARLDRRALPHSAGKVR